jgi:hypothetical protein
MINPPALRRAAIALCLAGLIFPLYFQLAGSVYRASEPMLDSGGSIHVVPLPVSLVACAIGICLLATLRGTLSVLVCAVLFAAALLASALIAARGEIGAPKLVLIAQFVAPMIGLVFGSMVAISRCRHDLPIIFLSVLAILVPWQLGLTLWAGTHPITHDLVLFSIYQHLQYVPVVLECAFVFCIFSLWNSGLRPLLFLLAALMAVYAGMSFSMLSGAILLLGVGAFAAIERTRLSAGLLAVVVLSLSATIAVYRHSNEFRAKTEADYVSPHLPEQLNLRPAARETPVGSPYSGVPLNLRTRFHDWALYGRGILESPTTLLVGHPTVLDRTIASSAHNYYLDLVYNFGVPAALPLLALISLTLWHLFSQRTQLAKHSGTVGLALVVLFLVLVDSNFKVTLRQPYPGIFAFFVWGLLLARLARRRAEA